MVAVERGEQVIVELDGAFEIESTDTLYLVGTGDDVERYFQMFPDRRSQTTPRLAEI